MGSHSAPAPTPAPPTPPSMPVYNQVETDEVVRARGKSRKRLLGAMNTRKSYLAEDTRQDDKTLLGS